MFFVNKIYSPFIGFFLKLYEENGKHENPAICYCEQNCHDSVVTMKSMNVGLTFNYI